MEHKRYVERDGLTLKVSVYYSLVSGRMDGRGYYLSVTPVTVEQHDGYTMESFMLFSGVKKLIKPVARKSAKAFEEAKKLAAAEEEKLIAHVLAKSAADARINRV